MAVTAYSARGLSFGDAFADAFGVYGRRFGAVVAVAAVLAVVQALLVAAVQAALAPEELRAGGSGDVTALDGGDWALWGIALLATIGVAIPFTALLVAALYRVREGGTAGDSLRFALSRVANVTLTAVVAWLALAGLFVGGTVVASAGGYAIGGTLLAVLLGVLAGIGLLVLVLWLGTRWYAAVPAAAAEQLGPAAALRRSAELVRGRWWTVFGIVVVASLIVASANGFVGAIFGAFGGVVDSDAALFVADVLLQLLTATFAMPVIALFAVAIYDGLRAEKEAATPAVQSPQD